MEPVKLQGIPGSRAITYSMIVCDYSPFKAEPDRCRLIIGYDKLTYDHETATSAANLLETKLILHSTISTPGAKFMTLNHPGFFVIQYATC